GLEAPLHGHARSRERRSVRSIDDAPPRSKAFGELDPEVLSTWLDPGQGSLQPDRGGCVHGVAAIAQALHSEPSIRARPRLDEGTRSVKSATPLGHALRGDVLDPHPGTAHGASARIEHDASDRPAHLESEDAEV